MHLLVTGGGGFIGSHIVPFLERLGHFVRVFDLYEPTFSCKDFVRGDIRDRSAVDAAMDGIDAVVHLAAAHHDFGISKETFFDVNEGGARVLADAMTAHGVTDLCVFSSVAVYGIASGPINEDTRPQPDSDYGASKLAAEGIFREWAKAEANRKALIVRPTVVFGPGNFANMYSLIRQIHRRRFLQIGRGDNQKSICFIDNLVAGVAHHWLDQSASQSVQTLNYVDHPDLTSREITDFVCDALGQSRPPRIPYTTGLLLALPFDLFARVTGRDTGISVARVKKLAKVQTKFEASRFRESGFEQPFSLPYGIRKMVEWYLSTGQFEGVQRRIPPENVQRSGQHNFQGTSSREVAT